MSEQTDFQGDFNDLIVIGMFKNKVIYYDEKSDKLFYSWQEEQSFSSNYISLVIFYHSLVFLNNHVIVEDIFRKLGLFITSTILGLIFFYDMVKKEEKSIKLRPFFIEFHDKDEVLKFLKKTKKNGYRMVIIILAILVISSIISFYWYIVSYKMMIPLFISSDTLAITIVLLSYFKRKNNNKIIKNTKIRERVIEDMIKRTEYLIRIR